MPKLIVRTSSLSVAASRSNCFGPRKNRASCQGRPGSHGVGDAARAAPCRRARVKGLVVDLHVAGRRAGTPTGSSGRRCRRSGSGPRRSAPSGSAAPGEARDLRVLLDRSPAASGSRTARRTRRSSTRGRCRRVPGRSTPPRRRAARRCRTSAENVTTYGWPLASNSNVLRHRRPAASWYSNTSVFWPAATSSLVALGAEQGRSRAAGSARRRRPRARRRRGSVGGTPAGTRSTGCSWSSSSSP